MSNLLVLLHKNVLFSVEDKLITNAITNYKISIAYNDTDLLSFANPPSIPFCFYTPPMDPRPFTSLVFLIITPLEELEQYLLSYLSTSKIGY